MRFHDTRYYGAMQDELRNRPARLALKQSLSFKTTNRNRLMVQKKIKEYLEKPPEKIFRQLLSIFDKNTQAVIKGESPPIHSNLLHVVSSVPALLFAYRSIRPNKGAMTRAWQLSIDRYVSLPWRARQLLAKTTSDAPDGLSLQIFQETSYLLRKGIYPWGSSRRVWIDKPGQTGVKRPLTIPPFMDRIVQHSILKVLEAIYEPWFNKLNQSFGFRPRRGVHDAIFHLAYSGKSRGLTYALEGDIKAAYDKVNREKLMSLLSQRIKDNKFLKLVSTRLDYQYYDTESQSYSSTKEGLPQGGIDSPYLWNIYMMHFDEFINRHLAEKLGSLNYKVRGDARPSSTTELPLVQRLESNRLITKKFIRILNKYPDDIVKIKEQISKPDFTRRGSWLLKQIHLDSYEKGKPLSSLKIKLIGLVRQLNHGIRQLPAQHTNKKYLRFVYARYADDWILLTNAPRDVVGEIKTEIKDFLSGELGATLSEEKTLITDMTREPAHFLGFELHATNQRKLEKKRHILYHTNEIGKRQKTTRLILSKVAGSDIFALPDKQRLISRMHMKSYCYKKGFPKEIVFLTVLDAPMIIERYNSVLRGLVNFYYGFCRNPEHSLNRWIYIIRYSCLKTLAQKYRTNIRGIFKKWGSTGKPNTIELNVVQTIRNKLYYKTFRLLTLPELISAAAATNHFESVAKAYRTTDKDKFYPFPQKVSHTGKVSSRIPTYHDEDFLERIRWVNLRTQANLGFGCGICGSTYRVEMHHINHVRKKPLSSLGQGKEFLKLMILRNRKQVALCQACHLGVVHPGKHNGPALAREATTMRLTADGRVFFIENNLNSRGSSLRRYTQKDKIQGWKPLPANHKIRNRWDFKSKT